MWFDRDTKIAKARRSALEKIEELENKLNKIIAETDEEVAAIAKLPEEDRDSCQTEVTIARGEH